MVSIFILGLNYPFVLNQWTKHKHLDPIQSWSHKQFRISNRLGLFRCSCISLSSFTTLQIVCGFYLFKAPAIIRLMQLAYTLCSSLASQSTPTHFLHHLLPWFTVSSWSWVLNVFSIIITAFSDSLWWADSELTPLSCSCFGEINAFLCFSITV